MAFGKRLKEARELRGITQTELSRMVPGLSQQAIVNSEQRDSQTNRHLTHIAKALQVSPDWLATGEGVRDLSKVHIISDPEFKAVRQYPLITSVQASAWAQTTDIYKPETTDTWMTCSKDLGPHGYILQVKGDSMADPRGSHSFPDGMLIFIKPECDCQPDDFVIAKRKDENNVTFKQLKLVDGELYLYALNPEWPSRYIKVKPDYQICGRVEFAGFCL